MYYYYYFENAALRASERWGAPVNKSIIGDELHNNTGIMPFSHKTGEGAELEKVPRP